MDISRINALTPDEVLAVVKLQELAIEAKEAAELIHENYRCFGIGEERIEVWRDRDEYNYEYLTYSGIWEARYLHQTYDVVCTPEGIFECFKAEYFKKLGVSDLPANINELAEACRYFKGFVNRIMAKSRMESSSPFKG